MLAKVGLVDIGDNRYINTLVIDRQDTSLSNLSTSSMLESLNINQMTTVDVSESSPIQKRKTMVMAHGYGAGLGFFFKNYTGLSEVPGWRIYAIDCKVLNTFLFLCFSLFVFTSLYYSILY